MSNARIRRKKAKEKAKYMKAIDDLAVSHLSAMLHFERENPRPTWTDFAPKGNKK